MTFIEKLPNLFIYVIPGFIFLKIHDFICSKKNQGDSQYFISSVSISFVITTFAKLLVEDDKWLLAFYTITASIILSIIFSLIYKSKPFNELLAMLKTNKTVHASMWEEIKDIYDVFIKVFIPNDQVIYYGLYKGNEEKDDDLYILMTDYEVRKYDGKVVNDYSDDRTRWVIINTKDINRVEIIYSSNSDRSTRPVPRKK